MPVAADGVFDDDGELHRLVDARGGSGGGSEEASMPFGARMELLRGSSSGGGGGGGADGAASSGGGDDGGGGSGSGGRGYAGKRDEAGRAARVAALTGTLFKDGYLTKQGHKVR